MAIIPTLTHLQFLDDLRESGEVEMLGAVPFIKEEFSLTTIDAAQILKHWMTTFNERKRRGEIKS